MYRLLTSEAETPSLVCDFISWSFFFFSSLLSTLISPAFCVFAWMFPFGCF